MIRDQLKKDLEKLVGEEVVLEHPTLRPAQGRLDHGDFSTNVAMRMEGNPLENAKKLLAKWKKPNYIEKAEVAPPGFINFWLSKTAFSKELELALKSGERYTKSSSAYGSSNLGSKKKIVIEIVSPNINKPLHIGHLRNGALGMSLANAYKMAGWKVIRDEINNDRGLHIMKAAYGYLLFGQKKQLAEKGWKPLLEKWIKDSSGWETPIEAKKKPDYFVGEFYVKGEKFLSENEESAGKQLSDMLQAWEVEDKDVWRLWKTMGDWVHEGIDKTYLRIGVEHDKRWYEHLLYKEGKDIIMDALKKGVFEQLPDGAIQANLEKYGLANKILIRRDGTAVYMTFDIALTRHKVMEFEADRYVWVVGNDQIDHFKRLFVIFEMLGLGKKEDFYHLAYGMVRVPGGKMSSRLGNVVLADDLIDKIVEMTKKLMDDRVISVDVTLEEKRKIAEAVSIGAIKYAMLKVSPMIDVVFDMDKSVSLEGDSGPYLQYTFARTQSVLGKARKVWEVGNAKLDNDVRSAKSNFSPRSLEGTNLASHLSLPTSLNSEELAILRHFYKFPEVVEEAAENYAPNLVCNFLFELAQAYNAFYNQHRILDHRTKTIEQRQTEAFRLALTEITGNILKSGLNLLGIEAPEKM